MSMPQKLNSEPPLTFEDVSKFFSFPLSEAADILGVSTSTLKAICNENGLERWPQRKYLAGKSIEDIKIEAAKEKSKAGLSKVDKQKNLSPSAVSSSAVSQTKDKPSRTIAESPKSQGPAPPSGSKSVYTWRSQSLLNSGSIIDASTGPDEFKHGFPSSGLSIQTNKWWGSDTPDAVIDSHHSHEHVDNANKSMEKVDSEGNPAADKQEQGSLSALRKQAVEEAREALKLGTWKEFGVDSLGKNECILLYRLFRNS
ncbi:hypothetical protein Droror1_Dr00001579 [Drosera rotundifolia]